MATVAFSELAATAASVLGETNSLPTGDLKDGVTPRKQGSHETGEDEQLRAVVENTVSDQPGTGESDEHHRSGDVERGEHASERQAQLEQLEHIDETQRTERVTGDHGSTEPASGKEYHESIMYPSPIVIEGDDVGSVAGTWGSSVAEKTLRDDENTEDPNNEDTTVASVFAEEDALSMEDVNTSSVLMLNEDYSKPVEVGDRSTSTVEGDDASDMIDPSALLPPNALRQTGKRTHRDGTPSMEERVERDAAQQEVKKNRTGLRKFSERRRPSYLGDYVTNVTLCISRILDKNGRTMRPIRVSQVKVPRNRRAALRSMWRDFCLMAEMEKAAALEAK
ncbi:hypothetical protein PC129_g15464 [Phytophthora cactorum]|nr:hypothetical protein Pcac1_g25117 [Phytophthora cactorum]KAG2850122.1 hypothetical protein PC113_g17060 [Phytophthora cactorum]KAG2915269.1 hypothetical protein PC117_g18053 [Phytophthora cactorum]KAG2970496.1 hypothetical protein PC118_g16824 [Phytophthora cactorum]KAG3143768.1 hypothetical protein C6341_g18962 [Phytophthora cactorum]